MVKSAIQAVLEQAGDFVVRRYSGRGMYGKSCVGVVADSGALLYAVIQGVDDDNRQELAEALSNMRSDKMGHDDIFYFPGCEYCADHEEEDEEYSEDEDEDEDKDEPSEEEEAHA